MSNFELLLNFLHNESSEMDFGVYLIVAAIIWAIQKIVVGVFKWIVIGIRGYQGVKVETRYISASDINEENWDNYDDDDYQKQLRQLMAANINLQAQVDTLKSVKNAKV